MKNKKEYNNGITLIVLVITIVILLILAGIAINQLAGDNGLFKRAKEASEKTQETQLKEEITLAVQSAITEGIGDITKENLEAELEKIIEANVSYNDGTKKFTVSRGKYGYTVDLSGNIVSTNGIALNKSTLNLLPGSNETLTANYLGSVSGEITWTSSNTSIATVENGKVTVVGTTGSATITAKCGSYTAICKVTIAEKITAITAESITVGKGIQKEIKIKTTPESNVEKITKYELTSSDTSKVTVDNDTRNVTGVAVGSATVTIKVTTESGGTVSTTCAVTVKDIGTLGELSWSDLSNISREIEKKAEVGTSVTVGTNTIKIGDTKIITIKNSAGTNEEYFAQIIGFNHDVREDGTKIGITFQLKDCMKDPHQMNTTNDITGGWGACDMRKYLNGYEEYNLKYNVYNNLEEDLKNQIVGVKKQTGLREKQTILSETVDKLWLVALPEVSSDVTDCIKIEIENSKMYEFYKNIENWNKSGWQVTRSPDRTVRGGDYCYRKAGHGRSGSMMCTRKCLF